jgi:hypothetical protein
VTLALLHARMSVHVPVRLRLPDVDREPPELSRSHSSRLFTPLGQVLPIGFTCSEEVQVAAPHSLPLHAVIDAGLGLLAATHRVRPGPGRRFVVSMAWPVQRLAPYFGSRTISARGPKSRLLCEHLCFA